MSPALFSASSSCRREGMRGVPPAAGAPCVPAAVEVTRKSRRKRLLPGDSASDDSPEPAAAVFTNKFKLVLKCTSSNFQV